MGRDELVGVSHQAVYHAHLKGSLHFQDILPFHFAWSWFADSLVADYEEGLMKTLESVIHHSPA